MKATGIVRRIDDLGRVVIPKEIRRTLRIREADSLEIYTDREGEIILKKYSPVAEIGDLAKQYVDTLAQMSGGVAAVTDCEQFVAVSLSGKKDLLQKPIHKELEKAISHREKISASKDSADYIQVTEEETPYTQEVFCPIISQGDVLGGVILLFKEDGKKIEAEEESLVAFTANILSKQMEE